MIGAVLVALLSVTIETQTQSPKTGARVLAIYVGPVVIRSPEGFTEPIPKVIFDSVKDIQRVLRKDYRGFRVVTNQAQADISLLVAVRGEASEASGSVTRPLPSLLGPGVYTSTTYASWGVLRTVFIAGTYQKEFAATVPMMGTWREGAQDIAKQLVEWVNVNFEKLIDRRPSR